MQCRKTSWSKQGCRLSQGCRFYALITSHYALQQDTALFLFSLDMVNEISICRKTILNRRMLFFSFSDKNKHHFEVSFTVKKSRYLSFNCVAFPYCEYFPGSFRLLLVPFCLWPRESYGLRAWILHLRNLPTHYLQSSLDFVDTLPKSPGRPSPQGPKEFFWEMSTYATTPLSWMGTTIPLCQWLWRMY